MQRQGTPAARIGLCCPPTAHSRRLSRPRAPSGRLLSTQLQVPVVRQAPPAQEARKPPTGTAGDGGPCILGAATVCQAWHRDPRLDSYSHLGRSSLSSPPPAFLERSEYRGGEGAGLASSYSGVRRAGPPDAPPAPRRRRGPAVRPDPAESAAGLPRRAAVNLSALARGPAMRGPAVRALLLLLLLLSPPAGAWYKHVASPRYHTVGRAAGLLMGLRRSPYVWRRALRPVAGSLAWDTQGLGASPQRLFAKDTLSPEPIPRGALLLSSGVRELLETGSGNPSAGLGVSAPWSQHATEPQQELEPRLGAPSWTRVKQARAFGVSPVQPWSAQ
ncbi:neuropeptide W isoform X2 [Neovison vison]|uniref:neuropeptide W isoform X2 n=1 Tax=Neovison vison TaxID=452646 RepID=UPI001CF06025|nr:neuropeptide W isoform X2 [Neogale vison]